VARCRRAADDAAREVLAATHAHQRSVDDHQTLVDARLAGIAAELAGGLVDGRPGPVCGSHEHPRPATAGQRISPSDVTAAAQRRAKAEHARRCAEQAAETAVRAVALAEAELTAAKERAAAVHVHSERAVKEARDRLAALTEELDVARAGFASIRERHAHLLGQAKRLARLAEAVGTAAEAQRRLDAALSSAEHEAVAAGFTDRAEARGAIRTSGECAELSARIAAWHDEAHRRAGLLAAAAATCVGDERDGVAPGARADAARSAAAAASREAKARAQELENAAAAARAAEAAVARFTERRRDLLAAEAELDAVRADAEPVLYLSKLTRGMAGQRRVALTTYVLRYWFEQVVQAANVRLSAISSGRYDLLRVDEGQARNERSGLTVAVLDRHTGEARSARSLSGGETFYTSLALALGLADVVRAQAGGIDLDSLFIDEGFGSLDADTLDEVLAVIEDLRERGRVVGIVSHLTELKELIPERVEVRRRDDGSSELRVVA
jgi:exonuclease SbcC